MTMRTPRLWIVEGYSRERKDVVPPFCIAYTRSPTLARETAELWGRYYDAVITVTGTETEVFGRKKARR